MSHKMEKNDLLIAMGDINANSRNHIKIYREILEKHGIDVLNDNRQRLIDLCQLKNLVIGDSPVHYLTFEQRQESI